MPDQNTQEYPIEMKVMQVAHLLKVMQVAQSFLFGEGESFPPFQEEAVVKFQENKMTNSNLPHLPLFHPLVIHGENKATKLNLHISSLSSTLWWYI